MAKKPNAEFGVSHESLFLEESLVVSKVADIVTQDYGNLDHSKKKRIINKSISFEFSQTFLEGLAQTECLGNTATHCLK